MSFPALKEAQGRLDARRKELADVFSEAGPDLDMGQVKSIDGDTAAKVTWIREKNAEIDAVAKELEGLNAVARAAEGMKGFQPGRAEAGDDRNDSGERRESKSFGQMFVESKAYTGRQGQNGPEAHLDIELKTLFESSTGWVPDQVRGPRVVDMVTRPLQVIDLIPSGTTTQNAVVYMEETTFTNSAAEVAEGGTYAESALALTEKNSPVRKIGTWLPVTDEQLEDVPQARRYIENRLPFMVRQRLDSQILVGNGSAPNLRGFLNVVGIQTQAKGTDPVPDAVYKALTKVRVTGAALPNAVVMNPADWQDVRLLRTADGVYIWGSPSEAGPARIWGLPVVEAQGLTENTALVGDFANFSELAIRRGIDVQITNSHSDYFINGKQAVRADLRAALVVYRPTAFCSVTGV